jgi:hypothetical protein
VRKLSQEVNLLIELVADFRPSQREVYDKLVEFINQIIHEIELIHSDSEWTKIYTDYEESIPSEIHCTISLGKLKEEE